MSQTDRIKEELGWLKVMFGLLFAMDASLVAWLAQNYETAKPALLISGLLVVLFLTGGLVWLNRLAYRRLRQLEQL